MKNLIGLLHIIVIVAIITSPIVFDYKLIAIGIVIYYLQTKIFGGCALTRWQYGTVKPSFFYRIFKTLRLPVTPKGSDIFANYILPPVLVAVILVLQIILDIKPIIQL